MEVAEFRSGIDARIEMTTGGSCAIAECLAIRGAAPQIIFSSRAGGVIVAMMISEGITERSSRQGRSLAGCKSPHRQLPVFGRLAYPMRGEATNRVLLGRKSPGCPAGVFAGYSGARSISIPTRGLPGQKPAAPTSQEWDSWTACRALRDAS